MPTLTATATDTTAHATRTPTAAVEGAPRVLLRLEGAVVLAAAVAAYATLGGGWLLFALTFLAPDLAFVGYLAGPRVGAMAYNATHSYLGPALLAAIGFALSAPLCFALALIWAGHVGFDRMLGYGLKYGSAFGFTHLGRLGAAARNEAVGSVVQSAR